MSCLYKFKIKQNLKFNQYERNDRMNFLEYAKEKALNDYKEALKEYTKNKTDFMKSILDREIKVCKFYGININD